MADAGMGLRPGQRDQRGLSVCKLWRAVIPDRQHLAGVVYLRSQRAVCSARLCPDAAERSLPNCGRAVFLRFCLLPNAYYAASRNRRAVSRVGQGEAEQYFPGTGAILSLRLFSAGTADPVSGRHAGTQGAPAWMLLEPQYAASFAGQGGRWYTTTSAIQIWLLPKIRPPR